MSILLGILLAGVALLALLWLVGRLVLQGPDQSQYDSPPFELTGKRTEPSAEHLAIVKLLQTGAANLSKLTGRERLALLREQWERMGQNVPVAGEIRPADAGGVSAEWIIAPNADPKRRVLYIHGGAFMLGSPRSHRTVTSELSKRARAAVLAIDYRLMPENRRSAAIEDCQTSYRWILENGPDGATELDALVVAGDSAGGNLTLMTVAWARDNGLRQADAVVALSPATDTTLGSPSLKANLATDTMLGPAFSAMATVPRIISLWFSLLTNRINPSNPLVSPLLGDLSGLPPTLVQASAAEMVLDDGVRYANKAAAAGSTAALGVWPFMLHVWPVFVGNLPEATEAFDQIEDFLNTHAA